MARTTWLGLACRCVSVVGPAILFAWAGGPARSAAPLATGLAGLRKYGLALTSR